MGNETSVGWTSGGFFTTWSGILFFILTLILPIFPTSRLSSWYACRMGGFFFPVDALQLEHESDQSSYYVITIQSRFSDQRINEKQQ